MMMAIILPDNHGTNDVDDNQDDKKDDKHYGYIYDSDDNELKC